MDHTHTPGKVVKKLLYATQYLCLSVLNSNDKYDLIVVGAADLLIDKPFYPTSVRLLRIVDILITK